MELQELINELEKAQGEAQGEAQDQAVIPVKPLGDLHRLDYVDGSVLAFSMTPKEARATAIRHNMAGEVLEQLHQFVSVNTAHIEDVAGRLAAEHRAERSEADTVRFRTALQTIANSIGACPGFWDHVIGEDGTSGSLIQEVAELRTRAEKAETEVRELGAVNADLNELLNQDDATRAGSVAELEELVRGLRGDIYAGEMFAAAGATHVAKLEGKAEAFDALADFVTNEHENHYAVDRMVRLWIKELNRREEGKPNA